MRIKTTRQVVPRGQGEEPAYVAHGAAGNAEDGESSRAWLDNSITVSAHHTLILVVTIDSQ